MQDFPLSYTEIINGTRVGKGIAFEILEVLTEKFKFNYELVMPERNIIGSTTDMEGSLLQLLMNGVNYKCFGSVVFIFNLIYVY